MITIDLLEASAVRLRLACDRDCGEERDGPYTNPAHGIGQKRGHPLPSLGGWHVLERGLKVLDELGSEPRVSNAIGGSRDLNHHDDDQPLLRIDKKRRAGRTCSNEMTELIRASAYGDAKSFRLFQPANHARVRRR